METKTNNRQELSTFMMLHLNVNTVMHKNWNPHVNGNFKWTGTLMM